MAKNPYQVLHLEEDASYEEIRQCYKHLTRCLHPDKQPLENYAMAKKHFEEIDEAYKIIGSPLRRFIFKEFGLQALKIMEELPNVMNEFEGNLSPEMEQRLRQTIIYHLYEQHAGGQSEKSKIVSQTVLNMTYLIKPGSSKRSPKIQEARFEYEMPLPDCLGFSNVVKMTQHTERNSVRDFRSQFSVGVASTQRLHQNYMLTLQGSVQNKDTQGQVSVVRSFADGTQLRVSPLVISNWELQNPKVFVQRSYENYNLAAMTNFSSIHMEINQLKSKKYSKSVKVSIEKGAFGIIPRLEMDYTDRLRLFVQLVLTVNFKQSQAQLNAALCYGFKLKLTDDLRLQMSNMMLGGMNQLEVTFYCSRFKVSFPLFARFENIEVECYKLSVFLLTYLFYSGYHSWKSKNKRHLELLLKAQRPRILQQKQQLNRTINNIQIIANEIKDRQIRQRGLVVIRAYLGKAAKIKRLDQKCKLDYKGNDAVDYYEQLVENAARQFLTESLADELIDVTVLLQAETRGGQIDMDLEHIRRYNPCLNEKQQPKLLLIYNNRGKMNKLTITCRNRLHLGGMKERYQRSWIERMFKVVNQWIIT